MRACACGCCDDKARSTTAGVPRFKCRCMVELVCKNCNHCLKHCTCVWPEAEVPYPEQLSVAKHEWRQMGVKL